MYEKTTGKRPEGQHHLAQGSALGRRTANSQRPERAASAMESKGVALAGRSFSYAMYPRALPWASRLLAFQAAQCYFRNFN